jgi:iron complex outermembrane receptor protein
MHTKNWGLYLQDEYQASENLTLNAGVRYDHYDLAGGSINPRFALIRNLSDATTLKLLYGTAFRPPTLYELYYQDAYLGQSAAGTLESETITTYEAVLEHHFKPDLRGSLSVFHYQLNDSIDRIDMEDTWENRSTIKALGFEAELQKKWASGMTGRVSYSLTDTGSEEVPTFERMEEDGEAWQEFVGYGSGRILNSPSHLFKLNLHAPLVKDKVFAGFETQYVSGRKTILGGKTAGSFVANLTLNLLNITEGMDCSFGIYNLFNESYGEPAWADNELETIQQDSRWFMFNLRYRF